MNCDDPTILAFDTSGPHLSAALFNGNSQIERHIEMDRGQAEALVPFIEEMMAEADKSFSDLDIVAVGVGPGNFTGIRISVSLARGLSMSLGIPAIGVSTFEAMLIQSDPLAEPSQIVSVAAPRNQAYVQLFEYGKVQSDPRLMDPSAVLTDMAVSAETCVTGYRSGEIASPFGARAEDADTTNMAARIANFALLKMKSGLDLGGPPTPLYVRAPDAAPPRNPAPTILNA